MTLYRLNAGPLGAERSLERIRFAVYAGPLFFFEVVEVQAGPVADQVAMELRVLMPDIAEAALIGDEIAVALIGNEARDRALVALYPQQGPTRY